MEPQPPRTFVGDLVSYFDQKPAVSAAWLAFLYSSHSQTHDLVLGVAHTGELDDIKRMTLLIKQVYLKEAPVFFASPEDDPATFELAQQQGLLFFSRQEDATVAQQLLEQLFNKQLGTGALQQATREHAVYALVDKAQLAERKLLLQPFAKDDQSFTPLFTSPNMLFLSTGQPTLPPGLTLAQLVWSKYLAGSPPRPVVLNPDTAFEARFDL